MTAQDTPAPIPVALEALWYFSQFNPGQIPYNEAIAICKRGELNLEALRGAFNTLVRRYDVWHSTVGHVGGGPTLIAQPPVHFTLPVVNLSRLSPEAAERQAVAIVADTAGVPYDLSRGPLVRPRLLSLPDSEHRLYLAMHHMAFDGVSLRRTILPELKALYEAFPEDPLEPPRAGYGDYARWEQQWMTTRRAEARLAYWRRRLTPAPRPCLPTDRLRTQTPRHRGGTFPVLVPGATAAGLHAVAQSAGGTLFQAFAAVWAILLHRLSGDADVGFGAPADLRQRSEFESVVGYCLSPVVLRIDLSEDPTCAEVITQVRNELLDGLDHLVPFERIVRDLAQEGGPGGNPIYETLITLEPAMSAPDPTWSLRLMDTALSDAIGATKVDLELQLDEHTDGSITGRLIYDRDLFDPHTAERLALAWQRGADAVVTQPGLRVSELEFGDATDPIRRGEFNATATEWVAGTVSERFGEVAARQPLAPALTASGVTVSYRELEQASRAGADHLRAAGIGAGDVVAVCMAPSPGLVVGALATLEVGATLMLLDPADSFPTLRASASAAGCAAVLIADGAEMTFDGTLVLALPALDPLARPLGPRSSVATDLDQPCTLTPSGARPGPMAVLSHATLDASVAALASEIGLGPADTVLSLPTMLYQSPGAELWPALLSGARLVLAPAGAESDGKQVSSLIRAEAVSFLHATPSLWAELIASGLRSARALRALSGGGPLSRELSEQLLERCRVLWNGYAPAFGGGYCTIGPIVAGAPVTIGRPVANHRAHVVDGRGRPTPVGFVGELLIAGPLAMADDPDPAMRVAEPGAAGWARRTGLQARWLADGRLVLAGSDAAT